PGDQLRQATQQRTTATQRDPGVHQVRCQLRWRAFEHVLDGADDLAHGLLQRLAHVLGRDHRTPRQVDQRVATAHLDLDLFFQRHAAAGRNLQTLRGDLTDQQVVLVANVLHDRIVEVVTRDAQALRHDDVGERDDGNFTGAATDVDDHRATR